MSFHTEGLEALGAAGGAYLDSRLLSNADVASKIQLALTNQAIKVPRIGGTLGRFAAGNPALTALKIGTPLAAVGGVLGAADVIAGQDSFANKAMDATAMGIGGFLGSVGGPMGTAAGAGAGKWASDSLQWLFGDKKTAEQRKLEEALALLKSGVI